MITGVGVDIVKIARFEGLSDRFFERVYTPREREYLAGKSAQSAAGLFAAKEAVAKAFGTGFAGLPPAEIEILHNKNGAPRAVLINHPDMEVHISISHTATDAIAFAVLVSQGEQ